MVNKVKNISFVILPLMVLIAGCSHYDGNAVRQKTTPACERFRLVIMVTLAAILGMMPLATGKGIGAEMRNGVGIASIGGLLVSGILTLVIMPILYDLFTRKNRIK